MGALRMYGEVFNDCLLGFAMGHAANSGLLDRIKERGTVKMLELAELIAVPLDVVREICASLARGDVVKLEGQLVMPGSAFQTAVENSGYFEWLLLGYGGMLASPEAVHGTVPLSARNGAAVASGSARIGAVAVDPILLPHLASRGFRSIVDLGCGSGQRLIALAENDYSIRGKGIDIDPAAVALAQRILEERGVQDRVSIECGDVAKLDEANWRDVPMDVVMMCFMGHDMWPYERATRVFEQFRKCFDRCNCFLMADTVRSSGSGSGETIFTHGFELTHALMGKYIPRIDEWERLFDATGWRLQLLKSLGVPHTHLFELVPS